MICAGTFQQCHTKIQLQQPTGDLLVVWTYDIGQLGRLAAINDLVIIAVQIYSAAML